MVQQHSVHQSEGEPYLGAVLRERKQSRITDMLASVNVENAQVVATAQ